MYDIVAITVNYKMKDKILRLLKSFFSDIKDCGLSIQVVVVDNASLDGVEQDLARDFPQVRCIVNSKNIGFGAANNIALRKFEAKYYFILNPDIIFPAEHNTVRKLYDFMEKYPKIGLAAPKLLLENSVIQPSCMRFPDFFDQPFYRLEWHKKYPWARKRVDKLLMSEFDHSKILPIDWATGAALFARAAALRQAGFFDERYFMYFEDCDLCRRLWQGGWPVYYKGDLHLIHGHERASAKVPGLAKSLWKNQLTRVHLLSLMKYWWKWRGEE